MRIEIFVKVHTEIGISTNGLSFVGFKMRRAR